MKIIAANWKLHKNPSEAVDFVKKAKPLLKVASRKVLIFPSAFSLAAVAGECTGSAIEVGAQNCHYEVSGAFTGENSAEVAKALGSKWVLLGHSERRTLFGETNALIAKKLKTAQGLGLIPMLCIGESLEEREAGLTDKVLQTQLEESLALTSHELPFVLAYEPVWAIGTGKVATSEQVVKAHQSIRRILGKLNFMAETPILYGGSVKPENARELLGLEGVDGFLVGGASLVVESFAKIVHA